MADYNAAIGLDPKYGPSYDARGMVYYFRKDFDQALADFEEAIRLGHASALVFNNRGIIYAAKGELDRAIDDYTEAIRLDPVDAIAFYNRGNAFRKKGDLERAIVEYDETLKRDPNHIYAHSSRGHVNFLAGKFDAAAGDYARALRQKLTADLVALRYITRVRLGDTQALTELQINSRKLARREWPYPIVDLYLGGSSLADALSATANADQRCEAHFYIGEWHLLNGERELALRNLQVAADTCPKDFFEFAAARAELKRIAGRTAPH